MQQNAFMFNAAAAKARSDSTTFYGRIVGACMVTGSETWRKVKAICTDALDRQDVVDRGIRKVENVEVLNQIYVRRTGLSSSPAQRRS